ncbi:MAG: CRISPR-associated endonuclease Cas2 [Bacteroidota bacterium]
MYVIAVYDVAAERTSKMLKLCRQYLNWIQNSVFEGELSPVQLLELEAAAKEIMDLSYDSFIIFTNTHVHRTDRRIIGCKRAEDGQFL